MTCKILFGVAVAVAITWSSSANPASHGDARRHQRMNPLSITIPVSDGRLGDVSLACNAGDCKIPLYVLPAVELIDRQSGERIGDAACAVIIPFARLVVKDPGGNPAKKIVEFRLENVAGNEKYKFANRDSLKIERKPGGRVDHDEGQDFERKGPSQSDSKKYELRAVASRKHVDFAFKVFVVREDGTACAEADPLIRNE